MAEQRIGIFPGVFDPVHAGHIGFALQSIQQAGLERVIFLPERNPGYKPSAVHFAHRAAMLKRAVRPYPQMSVLEMVSRRFSVLKTLPQLMIAYHGRNLVLLVGSDVVPQMIGWSHLSVLLKRCGLVIGLRWSDDEAVVRDIINSWTVKPRDLTIISSYAPAVSSSTIRKAIDHGQPADGLLRSVDRYASREWLYVSPETVMNRRQP